MAAGAAAYTIDKHDEETTGKLRVSPGKVEMEIEPGDSATRDITVTNQTGQTVTIMFHTENFQGSSDPSEAFVFSGEEDEDARGARDWLKSELDSIVLKKNESVTFEVTVDVPGSADPGGHYAALFATITDGFEEEEEPDTDEQPVSLFLIKVPGNIYEEGDIEDLRVAAFSGRGPIDIAIIFANQGDTHLQPEGRVRIFNIFGQQVAEIPIERWVVMPDSLREKVVQWKDPSLFGRFTAEVELDYGPDDRRIIASKSFWMISWPVLVAIVIVLAALIFLISRLIRRRRPGAGKTGERVPETVDEEAAEEEAAAYARTHVPLNKLFPSMDESRVIDVTDPETRKLCASLISDQVDLAQAYISEGRGDRARQELREAREAAQHLNLLSEIAIIDAMLSEL